MRSCLCGYFEVARIFFRGYNLIKTKDRKFCKGNNRDDISASGGLAYVGGYVGTTKRMDIRKHLLFMMCGAIIGVNERQGLEKSPASASCRGFFVPHLLFSGSTSSWKVQLGFPQSAVSVQSVLTPRETRISPPFARRCVYYSSIYIKRPAGQFLAFNWSFLMQQSM